MPGRSPHEVVLGETERAELEHRAACYTRPHREVQRAKLVLLAAEGQTNVEIGERLGMSLSVLARTLNQFEQHWNEVSEPFEWNFTRDDLAELIERLAAHEPQLHLAA